MTKKKFKHLVLASYKNNELNQGKVEQIANLLSKKELKNYIRELKQYEKKRTVVISLPYLLEKNDQDKIASLFKGKKIIYMIDSSLVVGIKVIDNDLISEYNLKNTLEQIASHVKQNYD